jgi:aminoglycoside 3-N-acetyltransferase
LSKKKILKNKIEKLLKDLGISRNDNIIMHSNTAGIHQFFGKRNDKNLKFFFGVILNYIGETGTILIPTYNYDFTKGKPFHRRKTLSQVGELGNFLIKTYSKNRTSDPVFSHIVFGVEKNQILKCDTRESFGDKSVFNYILNKNFKIICFCCSPATMTFIHFIEKKFNVKYRYNKYFKSFININNKVNSFRYKYFVGKKSIDYILKEKKIYNLLNKKLKTKNFGRFNCSQINTKLLFKLIKNKLMKNEYFLINNEN